jgi:hypothetical protein
LGWLDPAGIEVRRRQKQNRREETLQQAQGRLAHGPTEKRGWQACSGYPRAQVYRG